MSREQWLKARQKGIGASDAAAVVGLSPHKTNVALWEEKTGRRKAVDISDKPFVQYGHDAEPHLRELFLLDFPQYTGRYDEFGVVANNKDCPFAFATLDGELTDGVRLGVLEIKTTEIVRAGQWQEWDNRIPQHYYCQILHQFLATCYDFAWLKAQIKHTDKYGNPAAAIRHYHFEQVDCKDDILWLAEREAEFWWHVENDKRPALKLPEI